jgi:SAM-dependent methyltransferase
MIYLNDGNNFLLELLPKGNGKVLDCGCGAGDNARILQSQGWEVTGITSQVAEEKLASRFCKSVIIADLDAGMPREIGPYDIILFSHILEHLKDPIKILMESKKMLVPGGLIGVALPNFLYYKNRLDFLLGKFEYSPEGGLIDKTHLRFFTFKSGAALLEAADFKILQKKTDGNFPLWKARQVLPESLIKFLNHLANRFLPGLFGYQCVYIARSFE